MATRHLCRIIVLQSLYEWSFWGYTKEEADKIFERNFEEFGQDIDEPDFAKILLHGVVENIEFIDEKIKAHAKSLPFENIPLIEKNILRLAIFEMFFQKKESVPIKVAINEAIELAKKFSTTGSGKFINGVLGSVFEDAPGKDAKAAQRS
ncbi:MAG: transcription antitermination factor NusB, N utilization substance protein B [Parcubacteria group bacterium GW2011_GWC1_41_7]|nr:MAG: transcription antitermination factor NusB, N utilization substance protein B [Parcubacteria group bacterium GW2011_GWC1_41_7]